MSVALTLLEKPTLPVYSLPTAEVTARDEALAGVALIAQISNQEENDEAVRAAMVLKAIATRIEKQRKAAKEPFIETGRQIDRLCETFLADVSREMGRISNLASEFQLKEQRRIREEQDAQRRELEKIEALRQAEILRIARTEKDESKAAEKIRAVEESSQAQTQAESKPILAQRTSGQMNKDDWDIEVLNPHLLAYNCPDLVKVEPLLGKIKEALRAGRQIPGITATKVLKTNFRAAKENVINV